MCSAIFMTGLAPNFAENVGFFTAPYEVRAKLGRPVIDRANRAVHVTLPNGVTRTAKYLGSQGCVTLPLGESTVHFTPVVVKSRLPDPTTEPWPMGDLVPSEPLPAEIDATKLRAAESAPSLDCSFRGHLERACHRRALRQRHRCPHAARRLVYGQKHYRHAVWQKVFTS
jgi:hypothetical protein